MSSGICGIRIGRRDTLVLLEVIQPTPMDPMTAELFLADPSTDKIMCLLDRVEIKQDTRKGTLEAQKVAQIGFAECNAAKLVLRIGVGTNSPTTVIVEATLRVIKTSSEAQIELPAITWRSGRPDVFWTVMG